MSEHCRLLTLVLCALSAGMASAQQTLRAQSQAAPPQEESHPPYMLDDSEGAGFPEGTSCADCCEEGCWESGGCGGLGCAGLGGFCSRFHEFTSRNSQTHGRAVGLGDPLRGTSWLNRPYSIAIDYGAFVMTGRPADGVRAANDQFVALSMGWDWDHYWGAQARVGWSTPELNNVSIGENGGDNMFLTDLSLMYYPWGDSRVRPYWRMGMGLTDMEFTNPGGIRQQEFLYTIPFGVGVKYQFRRWLVWRGEIINNLAIGSNEANTMDNLTLTFGLEARFGGRPSGYWAWRPRGCGF